MLIRSLIIEFAFFNSLLWFTKSRIVTDYSDNVMATSRIANNTLFANIGTYKAFVQREKDDVKELSRMAANTARTFENTSREFAK
jgi:hypothetical protein